MASPIDTENTNKNWPDHCLRTIFSRHFKHHDKVL